MCEEEKFLDILIPRRAELSALQFMTKSWNPQKSLVLDNYCTPQKLKEIAADSVYIDAVLEAECANNEVCKKKLKHEVIKYLDEMGLEKKQWVIRWMGVFLLKITSMMKVGIFVNETAVLKVRSSMGNNPILFLPTHRSYADFCVMTYLCYHYDIDFPAVAAGMDFYSMAVVGRCMRDTCAFYIRRTLVGERLYAATLRQYVRTLVSRHCAPIEFFLEGTRSRSNKSLSPKYGMLSMSMVPFFAREVSDITIVPVNISYDRLMEHLLFAYEHIGVPKPKESTGGLLKALRSLKGPFGNIYINLGKPLSVKDYLQNFKAPSEEIQKPIDLQQITLSQYLLVQDVANYVVDLQQKNTVATISNLVALVLMKSLVQNEAMDFEEVLLEVRWMIQVLRHLGATVFENDVKSSVQRILDVHSKMIMLDKDNKLKLISSMPMDISNDIKKKMKDKDNKLKLISSMPMDISNDIKKKMKGHTLKAETMVTALPVIQLQLYVNPVLHYLVPAAVVTLIVARGVASRDQLAAEYHCIRQLLRHEFIHLEKTEEQTLNSAISYCFTNDVISAAEDAFVLSRDDKLQFILKCSVWPALTTLLKCADIIKEQTSCEHNQALKLIQERVESSQCHPYCLSLEAMTNCLQGLVLAGAIKKEKSKDKIIYELVPDVMEQCYSLVNSVLPLISVNFGKGNSVIIDQSRFPSRL